MNLKKDIIIVIIAVVLIGVAGYFGLYNKTPATKQTAPDLSSIPIGQPTPLEEMVGWKTYRNDIWGISLKYPSSYNLGDYKLKKGGEFASAIIVQITNPKERGEFAPNFQIQIFHQPYRYHGRIFDNIIDFVNDVYLDKKGEPQFDQIKLGQYEALKTSRTYDEYFGSWSTTTTYIYFMRDKDVFLVNYDNRDPYFKEMTTTMLFD